LDFWKVLPFVEVPALSQNGFNILEKKSTEKRRPLVVVFLEKFEVIPCQVQRPGQRRLTTTG
jgi:hypothetical protein